MFTGPSRFWGRSTSRLKTDGRPVEGDPYSRSLGGPRRVSDTQEETDSNRSDSDTNESGLWVLSTNGRPVTLRIKGVSQQHPDFTLFVMFS